MRLIILFTLLYALSEAGITKEEILKSMTSESAMHNENDTELVSKSQSKSISTTSKKHNKDTYRDVAIYKLVRNRDEEMDKASPNNIAKNEDFMANNQDVYEKEREAYLRAQREAEKGKEIEDEERIYNISGYCTTRNDMEVERIQAYSVMDCRFNENDLNIDSSTMFASFSPIYEKLALIGKPVYLNQGNKKLPIENGIILTADQTNLNVATFVNDVKIKNLLANFALTTNDIVYATSMDYLTQLKASKITEELDSSTSASGTSVTKATNTAEIEVSTYLTVAGIQLISSVVDAIGNFYIDNNYPLYKVASRTQYYVDFNIKIKGNKKSLIDYKVEDYNKIAIPKTKNYMNTKDTTSSSTRR
jgi:hypothetical protein